MKYSCRSGLLRAAHAYDLQADRLVQHGPAATVDILFSDISEIVLFKERRPGSSRLYRACKIMAGRSKLVLTSAHRTGLLQTQDRTGFYNPFIKQFIRLALALTFP
ncbi:MAG: hypothetical protein K2Z80_15435 [Xanthobacteraceae bacterium]|nr:hypothetical protein [Xanthobacteraceae bacterium]